MGELRGGYIPGDLPEADQAEAERLLFEHIMGGDQPETEQPPDDGAPSGKSLEPWEQDLYNALLLADPTVRGAVLEAIAKEQARDRRGRFASGPGGGAGAAGGGAGGAGGGATNPLGRPLRSSIPGQPGGPPPPRASLAKAKTVGQVEDVTSQELEQIMGRPVPVSFSGLSPAMAREHAEGLLMAAQRYPNNDLRSVTTYGPRGTRPTHPGDPLFQAAAVTTVDFAGHHSDDMAISTFGGEAHIRGLYASSASFGGHAAPSPTGTSVHEMGHVVSMHSSADITTQQLIVAHAAQAGATTGPAVVSHIAHHISIYAADSPPEAMAEAFADVLVNGASAMPLSNQVVSVIDAYYQSANLP